MSEKTLLLFEADSNLATQLKTVFEAYNFSVMTAETDSQVQEYLGLNRIDFFIIRAENPHLNGLLLCKKIREIEQYRTTPILLLSSDRSEEDFEKHKKLNYAADYYIKLSDDVDIETIIATSHALVPFLDLDEEEEESPQMAPPPVPAEEMASMDIAADLDLDFGNEEADPMQEMQEALSVLMEENESLKEQLAALDSFSTAAPVPEFEAMKSENERMAGEIRVLREGIADRDSSLLDLQEKISDLSMAPKNDGELESLSNQLTEKEESLERLEKRVLELEAENSSLKTDEESKEAKIEELTRGWESDMSSLKDQLAAAKDRNDDLNMINIQMKENVKAVSEEKESLQSKASLNDSELKNLSEKNESLEVEVAALKSKLGELTLSEHSKEESLAEIKGKYEREKSKADNLESSITEMSATLEKLEMVAAAHKQLLEETAVKDGKIEELNVKVDQLNEKTEVVESMTVELESLKVEARKVGELEGRVKELVASLEKVEKENESFQSLQDEKKVLEEKLGFIIENHKETQAALEKSKSEEEKKMKVINGIKEALEGLNS
jgi:chromosome segregation ATPase